MRRYELDDNDVPEYWPHLRNNRDERYNTAKKLLAKQSRLEKIFKNTFIEILELPTITEYND